MESLRTDLAATAERVEALDAAVERAHAERDGLILEALDAGLPATEVAVLARVSSQRVRMLARRRRTPVPPGTGR